MNLETQLSPDLIEHILAKLGISAYPHADLSGLSLLYGAWCAKVPFDNVRKLIHVQSNNPAVLPGDNAVDFFENWLAYGTGGTCWSGNGALYSLLSALGFAATRGVATMLVGHDLPPNHGTVVVDFEGNKYIVDASILHGTPLLLNAGQPQASGAAWRATVLCHDDKWHILWQPLHLANKIECRIEYMDATEEDFRERHELTRGWSPFNYQLHFRSNRGDSVIGIANNKRVCINANGEIAESVLSAEERLSVLINELGVAEKIARKLPLDKKTPPPPGSEAARI